MTFLCHRLSERLRAQGHDVVESRERGPDPADRVLLEWAGAEDCILVTMDKDFGAFIFLDKAPHCGMIRLPEVPADRRVSKTMAPTWSSGRLSP
ncbi:MAG: DUF5615 family PIN-like protein [Gammaproteobacteria bacterium]